MEKEQNQNIEQDKNDRLEKDEPSIENNDLKTEKDLEDNSKDTDKSPEDKILELEDKIARTFAEMENQRRRFEKEREDAFEYGGFAFAKEALNLIDNLERSKQILNNDQSLQNTEALKKILEHLDIINKDIISVFSKNNIKQIECLNKKLDFF